jgi:MATE family multidrug resistance protein
MLRSIISRIVGRWSAEGGYRDLLRLALPLVVSNGVWTVQHFVDRMYLVWFSSDAAAAAMPAGMTNFALLCVFLGTAGYVGTFVAQYHGARMEHRIGPTVWQGMYVALAGSLLLAACIPLAGPVFRLIGHAEPVMRLEITYFKILCLGAFPAIAGSALAGFFSGRGRTLPVMWINAVNVVVNVGLDYVLIFGHGGFPAMGVAGAALATVIAGFVALGLYLVLLFSPRNQRFNIRSGWRLQWQVLGRLLRFGLPSGIQFLIDVGGFTIFLLILGRLGTTALAATNIAFTINSLAFMPMLGIGIAVSIMVGQYQGRKNPVLAEYSTYSGFFLTIFYMSVVALLYMTVPRLFLAPLAAHAQNFKEIEAITIVLLRFVAVYSVFDTMNIIFASALRGAGDTRYIMSMMLAVSLGVLVVPSYLLLVVWRGSLYTAWLVCSVYVVVLGFTFFFRFLGGKWKHMRMIEEVPPIITNISDTPATPY